MGSGSILPKAPRRRPFIVGGIAVCIASSVAIVSSQVTAHPRPASADTSMSKIPTSVFIKAPLPQGVQPPASLAIAADGSAWFWVVSTTHTVLLYHWTATSGSMSNVDLGSATALHLNTGVQNAIAVTTSYVVVGANRSLVLYNLRTNSTEEVLVPSLPADGGYDTYLPPQYQTVQAVSAMASSPSGRIAVAISNASAVEILNPVSLQLSPVQLPSDSQATGVTYSLNGSLAIAVTNFASEGISGGRVEVVAPTSSIRTVSEFRTTDIAATSTGNFYESGDKQQLISPIGSLVRAPVTLTGSLSVTFSPKADVASIYLGSGKVVWISRSGLVVDQNTKYSDLTMPTYSCSLAKTLPILSPGSKLKTSGVQQCSEYAWKIVGSESAGVYVLTQTRRDPVYYVPVGAI